MPKRKRTHSNSNRGRSQPNVHVQTYPSFFDADFDDDNNDNTLAEQQQSVQPHVPAWLHEPDEAFALDDEDVESIVQPQETYPSFFDADFNDDDNALAEQHHEARPNAHSNRGDQQKHNTSSRSLPSSRDVLFPPISQVLVNNGCPQMLDNLKNCLKYKNTKAIEHTGNMLSDRGLDNITKACKKAVEENMICHRCKKEIKSIDKLCYCPEESDEKCHHGTSCCNNRKIKLGLTSGC